MMMYIGFVSPDRGKADGDLRIGCVVGEPSSSGWKAEAA